MLLEFTYYVQNDTQEILFYSGYYAIYIQVCINNSVHIHSFIMTFLLECICEWYQRHRYGLIDDDCYISVY